MHSKDLPEFKVLLQEMASIYRGTIYNDFFASAYWKVLSDLPMAAIRQACLDLMGSDQRKDGMPSAAEIKACAKQYHQASGVNQYLRCCHTDPSRRDEYRVAWRCPAEFVYQAGVIYCKAHRGLCPSDSDDESTGERPPATPQEISEVFAEALATTPTSAFLRDVCADQAKRLAAGESPVQAAIRALTSAIGQTMPDDHDSIEVVQARKADALRRAKEAGLLPHEPVGSLSTGENS